jgi:hypothetical protein
LSVPLSLFAFSACGLLSAVTAAMVAVATGSSAATAVSEISAIIEM